MRATFCHVQVKLKRFKLSENSHGLRMRGKEKDKNKNGKKKVWPEKGKEERNKAL